MSNGRLLARTLWFGVLLIDALVVTRLCGEEVRLQQTEPVLKELEEAEEVGIVPDDSQAWQHRALDQIQVEIMDQEGRLPPDHSERLFSPAGPSPDDSSLSRRWAESLVEWAPAEMVHQPLYFDDVPLERYGQSAHPHLQPFLSGARFFGSFPVMPYKVGLDHPHDRVSTLGYYRPGSCAPCVHQSLPFQLDAATLEAATWVGFVFLLP